jgi:hypothetical protein
MEILLVQLGSPCECVVSTSLLRGLFKKFDKPTIYVLVNSHKNLGVFRHNRRVKLATEHLKKVVNRAFDLIINLSPNFNSNVIKTKRKLGFGTSTKNDKKYYNILYGKRKTRQNIFQVYYSLANLKWSGEGYDICYYPNTKSNYCKTGLTLSNANLRAYIIGKLKLNESRLWNVPFKKNIFKKMDEINRCQNIITDNNVTTHLSIALRKYTYFLQTVPVTTKFEFFDRGQLIKVPTDILRWQ